MRHDAGSWFRKFAAVFALGALGVLAPPSVGQVGVDGTGVGIAVTNPASVPLVATVEVTAVLVSGEIGRGTTAVRLAPGETSTVVVPFDSEIDQVIAVGIVLDDGVPF